jgi:hypothetical protein
VNRRTDLLGVRVNAEERRVVELIAQHEERTPSDVVRRLLRQRAAELGITPTNDEQRRPTEQVGVRV